MQNPRERLTGESQAPGHFGDGDVQSRDYIFKQDFTWVRGVCMGMLVRPTAMSISREARPVISEQQP